MFKNSRLAQWIKALGIWIYEAKLALLWLLVIAVAVYLGCIVWHREVAIRVAGYSLQLLGMILTINSLLRIRIYFGRPDLRTLFVIWIKNFPKWKRRYISVADGGHFNVKLGVAAAAKSWTPDNPDQSLEKRIEGILRNLNRINEIQNGHAMKISTLQAALEEHRLITAEETHNSEKRMRSDLESLHMSDWTISLIGLIWLTVGITMSTMAPELYQWLH
ncbi:MAG: hypothetical protein ACRD22_12165 [Terriglobia bacterium]